ncbi:hypothetical protein ACFLS8_05750, partial [Chloroflexota bacterium]
KCSQKVKTLITSEITKQLERWFAGGVTYRYDTSILSPARSYTNMPDSLNPSLKQKHWLICFNLLKEKGMPCKMWPSLLILLPAHKKPEAEIEDLSQKIRPIIGIKANPIPAPFIWNTRNMPPFTRAEKVARDWFELTESRWIDYIAWALEQDQDTYLDRSISAVNGRLKEEQVIAKLGYDYFDIMQYYMRKQRFYYRDISDILEEFGIERSEEAVRKSFKRQEMKIYNEIEN